MPRRSVARRSLASADMGASASRSACKDIAVKGERSSCAASAINRRWVSIDWSTRASRRLIATTNGRTSLGRCVCCTGCRACSARWSISADKAAMGRNILRIRSATTSSSTGTSTSKGSKACQALFWAISSRASVSCAKAMRSVRAVVLTSTRSVWPLTFSVCKPSGSVAGSGKGAFAAVAPSARCCTITRESSGLSGSLPESRGTSACRSNNIATCSSVSSCSSCASLKAAMKENNPASSATTTIVSDTENDSLR